MIIGKMVVLTCANNVIHIKKQKEQFNYGTIPRMTWGGTGLALSLPETCAESS